MLFFLYFLLYWLTLCCASYYCAMSSLNNISILMYRQYEKIVRLQLTLVLDLWTKKKNPCFSLAFWEMERSNGWPSIEANNYKSRSCYEIGNLAVITCFVCGISWRKHLKSWKLMTISSHVSFFFKSDHRKTCFLKHPALTQMDEYREFRWWEWDVEQLRVSFEKGEGEILIDTEHFLKFDLSLFRVSRGGVWVCKLL